MKKRLTLIEVTPDWMSNGIITALTAQTALPWTEDSTTLELEYYGNRSGDKLISPLVRRLLTDDVLEQSATDSLAKIILAKYLNNWRKVYDALTLEYNPIDNYKMTETENITAETSATDTGTVETTRQDESETNTSASAENHVTNSGDVDTDTKQSDKVYGFNSTAGKNASENTTTTKTTDNTKQDTTNTDTQNTTTSNTSSDRRTDNLKRDSEENRNRNTTRSGNTGAKTQEMLQAELELRKTVFFDTVFADIDTILTSPIYI